MAHGLDVSEIAIVLMSDTHVSLRGRELPSELWREVERADLVVHAGDWVSTQLLDELCSRSRRLLGVYGNNDGPELRTRLPDVATATVGGVRVTVRHDTGDRDGRDRRMRRAHPDTDVLVFGHSHIPWDTTSPDGLRLLNPGSATDRRRQPHCTFMTATIAGGALTQVRLHRI
jgi:putative phosphoesterase